MDTITLRKPDDFHLHLRDGEPLAAYAAESEKWFGRALVMPNIRPAVTDPEGLTAYRDRILQGAPGLEPLMTFQVLPGQTREQIRALKRAGAIAGKYYPAGVTTHSEGGAIGWESCAEVFGFLEEEGLVLTFHGELPGVPPWEGEQAFLPGLSRVAERFPRLKIVMEHISTAEAAEWVAAQDLLRIAATVTLHHFLFAAEELWSPRFSGHYYCKPLIQGRRHRDALREFVLSGARNVFFGSDSAPHPVADKEGREVSPGIFSAPVAIPLLVDFFLEKGSLAVMENFLSENGAVFYGLPLQEKRLTLVPGRFPVPERIGGARPLMAGRETGWRPG